MTPQALNAQSQPDTTKAEILNEAIVRGVRAQKNAPYAVANVDRKALQNFSGTGKELPFLFSTTPGVLSWSENGLGTGTAYMRIRGAGDSRINVTIDGVPLNSPEDQCVFWANMNSYSAIWKVLRSSVVWVPQPTVTARSAVLSPFAPRLHPTTRSWN